jgi:predicted ATPase
MMTTKLSRLPRATCSVLELASCEGDHVDVDALAELGHGVPEQIEQALFALCDEGLIAPPTRASASCTIASARLSRPWSARRTAGGFTPRQDDGCSSTL